MVALIYLAGVAGNLQAVLGIGSFALSISGALALLVGFTENEDSHINLGKYLIIGAVVTAIAAALIPDTNTIYMMAGASIAEAQIAAPENQEVFSRLRDLVVQKLDAALDQ